MPSGEVITLFVPVVETATNNPISDDHSTLIQLLASDADLLVHVAPSGEVITLFVPLDETATNKDNS